MILNFFLSFFKKNKKESGFWQIPLSLLYFLSFLNLAQNQELCVLFGVCEQKVFATDLAEWMNHTFGNRFYVAVGQPVTDRSELPDRFQMLESLIENKFYQKETRVFLPDHVSEDTGSEQFLKAFVSFLHFLLKKKKKKILL